MGKAELGTKRVCLGCGSRFYDLNRLPAVCPNCAHKFSPDEIGRNRRARQNAEPAVVKPAETKQLAETVDDDELDEVLEVDEPEALSEDEEEDDDVLEDASDLGGDDDDVAEVMDNVGPEKDDA